MHPGTLQKVISASDPPGLRRWLKSTYFSATTALGPLLSGGDRRQTFWENMRRLDWGRPFLYLYSADDELCDGQKLGELVQQKRALRQDICARCWQQSEHVSHFRHHRQEYSALLLHFLRSLRLQSERQERLPAKPQSKL